MPVYRRIHESILLVLLLVGCVGCQSMMHDLQWHRLWRMNRGPALGRDSYNMSIADPPLEEAMKPTDELESGIDLED